VLLIELEVRRTPLLAIAVTGVLVEHKILRTPVGILANTIAGIRILLLLRTTRFLGAKTRARGFI
jgi:hypothetical protein